jgi:hypothetical protein
MDQQEARYVGGGGEEEKRKKVLRVSLWKTKARTFNISFTNTP